YPHDLRNERSRNRKKIPGIPGKSGGTLQAPFLRPFEKILGLPPSILASREGLRPLQPLCSERIEPLPRGEHSSGDRVEQAFPAISKTDRLLDGPLRWPGTNPPANGPVLGIHGPKSKGGGLEPDGGAPLAGKEHLRGPFRPDAEDPRPVGQKRGFRQLPGLHVPPQGTLRLRAEGL